MAIDPDTKDWTWVVRRPCPECGFEAGAVLREDIPAIIGENADAWRAQLTDRPDVRDRPSPDVWSTLEYGCHVRDVHRLYDERLQRMLTQDDPLFANWDQDATAVAERYGEQDPQVVATQLVTAAAQIADRFAAVKGDEWSRTASRSDGARFTVESFARYLVHDPVHHLYDVTGIRADASQP